jgi:hypothetical protein
MTSTARILDLGSHITRFTNLIAMLLCGVRGKKGPRVIVRFQVEK